jgi:hypothetical protein
LTNTGGANLSFTGITASGDFAVSGCSGSLAANATCNLSVSFTPKAALGRVGAVSIVSDATNGSQSVILNGTGVLSNVPICSLSAAPARVIPGRSATLAASCSPQATSYSWTGGTCTGTSAATCTVKPAVTTPYGVTGSNSFGPSNPVSAVVTVKSVDLMPILMLLLD